MRSDRGKERPYARPLILVSRCLGFDRCRYDGATVSAPFLERLARFADYVTACPEVEIGLGVPRQPIRLVAAGNEGVRLVQPATGLDVTERMEAFCRERAGNLDRVDGAVLKSRSPSCGISDARIHAGADSAILRRGPGLFGGAVLGAMEGKPVTNEGRLLNLRLREHFLTSVFTLARLRFVEEACRAEGSISPLVSFHASAKLLLAAAHREEGRMLGRIVAGGGPPDTLLPRYRQGLSRALARPLRTGPCVDSLMHAFGYFKKQLTPEEKALFLDGLEEFSSGRTSMGACRALIQAWTVRFSTSYLTDQLLLDPFPRALESLEDSSGGRSGS